MSGIAGIARAGKTIEISQALLRLSRGGGGRLEVREAEGATLGYINARLDAAGIQGNGGITVTDRSGPDHFASAEARGGAITLRRDRLGVRPLYYGFDKDGALCFASEVKGLLSLTGDVRELPPGHSFDGTTLSRESDLPSPEASKEAADVLAEGLRRRLDESVKSRMGSGEVGCWLSGGLDSSAMAALARQYSGALKTFAAGMEGAPDLEYARACAEHIRAEHRERVVSPAEALQSLGEVIYALESFDAWLVRSSVMNYLVAKMASDFVPAVFSGEGGDELFAGYEYLKALAPEALPEELVDITRRLHNTALQRVDRCSSAFGTIAHVAFLDDAVVDYALAIPATLKLKDGVEKWILRRAMRGLLPEKVLLRPKAKFWQGAGIEDLLARYADEKVSDGDFIRERELPSGDRISTKEELLYYRVFRERFGELGSLSWMGRTKGAPVA